MLGGGASAVVADDDLECDVGVVSGDVVAAGDLESDVVAALCVPNVDGVCAGHAVGVEGDDAGVAWAADAAVASGRVRNVVAYEFAELIPARPVPIAFTWRLLLPLPWAL